MKAWVKWTGIALAAFVATVSACWGLALYGGTMVCSPTETIALCTRGLLTILLPTIGLIGSVGVSASLILKQIKAEPKNFYPPAIDYLDQQNISDNKLLQKMNELYKNTREWRDEFERIDTDGYDFIVEIEDYAKNNTMDKHQETIQKSHFGYNRFVDFSLSFLALDSIQYELKRYMGALRRGDINVQREAITAAREHLDDTVNKVDKLIEELRAAITSNSDRLSAVRQAIADEVDEILLSRGAR